MNKLEFLAALRTALGKLPEQEVRASLDFYAEAIDDRVEDGAAEEEAVAALGPVPAIAAQIIAEAPPIPKAVAKMKTDSHVVNVVLAVVLSPVWVPLAFAFALAVACIYLSLWMLVAALWVCVACLILCAPIGIVGAVYCTATGFPLTGLWLLGCGLAGCGIGLFSLLGVKAASVGVVKLTRLFANAVKGLFVRRKERSGATADDGKVREKAAIADLAGKAKGKASAAAESARAAIHAATAPRLPKDGAPQPGSAPDFNARHDAPVPPPGYVPANVSAVPTVPAAASAGTAPADVAGPQPAQPEGGSHDHRA